MSGEFMNVTVQYTTTSRSISSVKLPTQCVLTNTSAHKISHTDDIEYVLAKQVIKSILNSMAIVFMWMQ